MKANKKIKLYQSKAGPIVAIIGSIILILGGVSIFGTISILNSLVTLAGETWNSLGIDPSILYINAGITLLLGIGGLSGSIISFRSRLLGGTICIIFGIIAIIGIFIPIGVIDLSSISGGITLVTMNGWGLLIDPFLIVIGGILCFILYNRAKSEEEVKAILEERYGIYFNNS